MIKRTKRSSRGFQCLFDRRENVDRRKEHIREVVTLIGRSDEAGIMVHVWLAD